MKPYLKYIGPLFLCGLIISLFINICFEKGLTLNLHQSNKIQAIVTANSGAVRYLFYKHMFVNVIAH